MRRWRLSWEILVLQPSSNLTVKRRKPFVELRTTLLLKSLQEKLGIPMKSMSGPLALSCNKKIFSQGLIVVFSYTLLVGKPPFETPDVKTTYNKIKLCSYSFPEHVPLSDAAKSLITRILNLDPSKRPTLQEILDSPFINHGGSIPRVLPVSTIACPPSASYIK